LTLQGSKLRKNLVLSFCSVSSSAEGKISLGQLHISKILKKCPTLWPNGGSVIGGPDEKDYPTSY